MKLLGPKIFGLVFKKKKKKKEKKRSLLLFGPLLKNSLCQQSNTRTHWFLKSAKLKTLK